jgi:predicted Zn-dependent protease
LFAVLLLTTITLFFACNKENTQVSNTTSTEQVFEKEINYLVETYGFDKKDIIVQDSLLVIEGDIIFDARKIFEKSLVAQQRMHYVDKTFFTSDFLNVRIPNSTPQEWRTALSQAISNWNALPATKNKVNMYYVSNSTVSNLSSAINVQFTPIVLPITIGEGIAQTSLPNVGTPRYLKINSTYSNINSLTPAQRVYIMTHELGHAIGFFHTNVSSNKALALQTNMPTPCTGTDLNSIMQPGPITGLLNWSDFSACDKIAYDRYCIMRK